MTGKEIIDRICRAVVEFTPDAVVTVDESGRVVYANPAVQSIFGYSPSELEGKPLDILLPSGMRKRHGEAVRRAALSGASRLGGKTVEVVAQGKDGRQIPIELSLSEWKLDESRYFTAVIRDISIRKEIEKKLEVERAQVERAKREWERTMDCVGDMIVLVDAEGRIKRMNRAFQEIASCSYKELLGKRWDDVIDSLGLEMNTLYGETIEFYHAGSGRWFSLNSYHINPENGESTGGGVIVMHDTTEMKQVAENLEKTRELLEAKNRELEEAYNELKMTQSQILQQEKMASIG
ncbi:MAG: PAS domain S-box protein, partial [Nitrospirae bacterium]